MRKQRFGMLIITQVRANLRVGYMSECVIEVEVEKDDLAHGAHELDVVGTLDNAATARNQAALLMREPLERHTLELAKMSLACRLENLGDALLLAMHHHAVGVEMATIEQPAQVTRDCGLACSEEADEKDMVAAHMARISCLVFRLVSHAKSLFMLVRIMRRFPREILPSSSRAHTLREKGEV